jgi:hypothetical protein
LEYVLNLRVIVEHAECQPECRVVEGKDARLEGGLRELQSLPLHMFLLSTGLCTRKDAPAA